MRVGENNSFCKHESSVSIKAIYDDDVDDDTPPVFVSKMKMTERKPLR